MSSPPDGLSLTELLPWQKGKSTWLTSLLRRLCLSPSWQMKTLVTPCHCVSLQQNNLPWLKVCSFCHFRTHGAGKMGVAVLTAVDFVPTVVLPFNKFLLRWKRCVLLSHFHIWYTDRGCGSILVSKFYCVIWSWQMGRHLRPDWVKKKQWHSVVIRAILSLKRQLTWEPIAVAFLSSRVLSQQWPDIFL